MIGSGLFCSRLDRLLLVVVVVSSVCCDVSIGMGGMTKDMDGQAGDEGYGRITDQTNASSDGAQERVAEGYGGDSDMNREIGG